MFDIFPSYCLFWAQCFVLQPVLFLNILVLVELGKNRFGGFNLKDILVLVSTGFVAVWAIWVEDNKK